MYQNPPALHCHFTFFPSFTLVNLIIPHPLLVLEVEPGAGQKSICTSGSPGSKPRTRTRPTPALAPQSQSGKAFRPLAPGARPAPALVAAGPHITAAGRTVHQASSGPGLGTLAAGGRAGPGGHGPTPCPWPLPSPLPSSAYRVSKVRPQKPRACTGQLWVLGHRTSRSLDVTVFSPHPAAVRIKGEKRVKGESMVAAPGGVFMVIITRTSP